MQVSTTAFIIVIEKYNSLSCFCYPEFGMNEDLRKMEAGGVSSQDLYVKRLYHVSPATHYHAFNSFLLLGVTGTY